MEGNYGVYLGNKLCGKVQVSRRGLYYRFFCRCRISGDVLFRLRVICGGKQEDLGILVPEDDGFGLEYSIPAKRLGEGTPEFRLFAKSAIEETSDRKFIPISPEEPFAYISRLKEAYLMQKNGQPGISL